MNSMIEYLPPILRDVKEFKTISAVEEPLFKRLQEDLERVLNEQFIQTASPDAIKRYEKMLEIINVSSEEDLQFRKERILNRLCMVPPYTKNFLSGKLDEIIGFGKWKMNIDYENYTFYIESSAWNQNWFEEIMITIHKVKPCNMVFVNKPYCADSVNVSEEIGYKTINYNYKIETWELGKEPFISLTDQGNIKRGDTMSVTDYFLLKLAEDSLAKVVSVRLNNTVEITEFSVRKTQEQEDGTNAILEYRVLPTPQLGNAITNIKLLDADKNTVTDANIYVPVIDEMLIKHIIKIKESV